MITGPGRSSGGRGGKTTAADDEGAAAALPVVPLALADGGAANGVVGAADDGASTAELRGESPDPNTIASTAAVIARQPSATQTAGCGRRERLGTRQFHPSGPLPGERLRWRLVPPLDPHDELKQLDATLSSIEAVLDVQKMRRQIAELEEQAASPDLWNDPDAAQKVTSKLSYLQGDLRRVEGLRQRLDDVGVLLELA